MVTLVRMEPNEALCFLAQSASRRRCGEPSLCVRCGFARGCAQMSLDASSMLKLIMKQVNEMIECAVTLFLVIQACSLHYCFAQALPYKVVLGCWRVFGAALCYKVVLGSTLKNGCQEKKMPRERHENENSPQDKGDVKTEGPSRESSFNRKKPQRKNMWKQRNTRKNVSRENVKRRTQEKYMPKDRDAKRKRRQRNPAEKTSVSINSDDIRTTWSGKKGVKSRALLVSPILWLWCIYTYN